jgi:hypothetical protein
MPDKDGWKKIVAAMQRREMGGTPVPGPVLSEEQDTARRLAELRAKYVIIGDKA